MNVKKFLTVLAGVSLLTACTSDDPVNGLGTDGNGQAGTPGSVSFRIDGLAGGSTVQSKAEGDNMIASAKENEIQALDVLVFAYCGTSGNTPVDPTASTPADNDLANTAYWKLQEVHYYSANNPTDTNDPFYRPAPPKVDNDGTIVDENYIRRFQLQGSGAYRSATITPLKGTAADSKRLLRFVLLANNTMLLNSTKAPATIDGANGSRAITLEELYTSAVHSINPFRNGDIISCPLPMVGNPETADKAYINTNDMTTTPVLSMSATLKRAVARFDIINETPHDFTLTSVEIPTPLAISPSTLRPNGLAANKYTVNLPTLDKADESGNPYWSDTDSAAMILNSAFYTSATRVQGDGKTSSSNAMYLTIHGKIGNQELEKEIRLSTTPAVGDTDYNIDPNTRYRLRISYQGGLQALMEVVDWEDDYVNPDLSNPQIPVIKVPANNVVISGGFDPATDICPYTGWFWDDRTQYQEIFPDLELGTHYAVMIPNNTNLEGSELEVQPKDIAETLAFDMVTKDESATFPFAFDIVNALTPDKPNTAWLRTHTYGATQDATDKKLWHVKLVAVEGAVNNMETLDPLKIRIYDKESPEYYAFIDVMQPADYPLTSVRTAIETESGGSLIYTGNTSVIIPEDMTSMTIYHANNNKSCKIVGYYADGASFNDLNSSDIWILLNTTDPFQASFNTDYTGTDYPDIILKIYPEGDEANFYLYRIIHFSHNK